MTEWQQHDGKGMPVDGNQVVEVKYLGEEDPRFGIRIEWPVPASVLAWHHDGQDDDIIAYRVHTPSSDGVRMTSLTDMPADIVEVRNHCCQLLDIIENYGVEIDGKDNDLIEHIRKAVDASHPEYRGPKMITEAQFRGRFAEAMRREAEIDRPPMFHEIMAAGADEDTAMFLARMLRKNGFYLVNPDYIGWPEIKAFKDEIRGGQDHREDAGGFFLRCISKLIGFGGKKPDEIVTHQLAAKRLLERVDAP